MTEPREWFSFLLIYSLLAGALLLSVAAIVLLAAGL